MTESYLPPVAGNLVSPPAQRGKWTARANLLQNLPRDLAVNAGNSTSIPSVWARALVFAEALGDAHHPQHAAITQEWRGLMGIFCFRECFGLQVTFHHIDFGPGAPAGMLGNRLRNSVYQQKPAGWPGDIYVAAVDDKLIGGTSPKTLFFTAPEYECQRLVPWHENGKLYDPHDYFAAKLLGEEQQILNLWVQDTMNALAGGVDPIIMAAFNDWLNAMGGAIAAPIPVGAFIMADMGLPAPYNFVDTYFSWGDIIQSDFLLQGPENPPILVWENGWRERPGRVFNSWHSSNFGDDKPWQVPHESAGDDLCGKKIPNPWIHPEQVFFTDRLLELPTIYANQVPVYGNNPPNNLGGQYVPPLRRQILNYLSPGDLAGSLDIQPAAAQGVLVNLSLPKTDGGTLQIQKTYNDGQIDRIPLEDSRPFEVWPNFSSEKWHKYYCLGGRMANLQIEPWIAGNVEATQINLGGDTYPVWEMESFPKALSCSWNGVEYGLIFPQPPGEAFDAGINWDVAVDLGTANTAVFFMADGGPHAPMTFTNRCVQIVDSPANIRDITLNAVFFSPSNYTNGIRSTSFVKFAPMANDGGAAAGGGAGYQPVIDGKAALGSKEWLNWLVERPALMGALRTRMKWGTSNDDQRCLYAYLKHLMLLICAEATSQGVNQLDLKWSYPSAFSNPLRISMQTGFTQLGVWINGLQQAVDVTIADQGETESVSVCKFLSQRDGLINPRVIADIGGRTSDIAVWDGNKLLLQTSVEFAGKLLTDYLRSKDGLRESILNTPIKNPADQLFNYFHDQCAHCFNNLMQSYGNQLCETFTVDMRTDSTLGYQQARSIIFLTFAGVTYYLGLILETLDVEMNIWFTGNGSRLINLVDPRALDHLTGFVETPATIFPALPDSTKQEVVRGLLSNLNFDSAANPKVIIGEDGYQLNGQEVSFGAQISFENLADIEVPDSFPRLARFVEEYNQCAADLDLVPLNMDGTLGNIRAAVSGRLNMIQNTGEGVEPCFLMELRFLLHEHFPELAPIQAAN